MKKKLIVGCACLLLFLLLIVLLRYVDVAAVGPENTSVGFSRINQAIHEATGVSMLWYKLTNYLGIFSIIVGLCFAFLGLLQMVKGKSVKAVDRELYVLGGLFVVIAVLYVLFEFVVINRRPVILPGDLRPEASFPSSHTMLVFTILGGVMVVLGKYIQNRSLCVLLQAVCGVLILTAVLGRLLSGVHWFTDIVGSIFISAALLFLFAGVLDKVSET